MERIPIAKPLDSAFPTFGGFEEELRGLLATRCRWVYLLGFLIAAAVHFFYTGVVPFHPSVTSAFSPYIVTIYDLYAFSLGLTVLVLFARHWTTRQLLVIDYLAISFNVLLSLFIAVVFDVNEVPAFGIGLLLFLHAAVIPVPVPSQAGLAATGALGFPLAMGLAYGFIPEVQAFWLSQPESEGFRTFLLEGTFQLAILAAVSVLITRALYGMRRSLHAAKRLGNYLVEKEIGRGGMGQVFAAQHALLCRPTAVKVLEASPRDREISLARFEREVRLSATLSHPNTITIYDFGRTSDDTFYYAMEYLKGLDLQELVERHGPVPPERAVFILTQICGSLTEAHGLNIVHRDIKPSNIYLTNCGGLYDFVKVLDFGLAKEIDTGTADLQVTKTGSIFGTPYYLSPETVEGAEGVDSRTDLYSLGAVGYWLLTGQPPFTAESPVKVIFDHVKTMPKRPSAASELDIGPELDAVILKCLEKSPSARYQTATELRIALESIRFSEPWTQDRAREWWELHAPEPEADKSKPSSKRFLELKVSGR